MSFEPYFKTVDFNAVDTLYSGVSSSYFGGFENYYSMPLFDYSFDSYMPSFSPANSVWYSNRYDFSPRYGFSSSTYDTSLSAESQSDAPKHYSFGSLTSNYSAQAPAAAYQASGKTSYRAVSARAKKNLGPEFLARVKEVAQNINCDYKDLLAVMNSESGLDPSIQNLAGYQAYGLIQFIPDAAREIGTSVDKLVKMSAVEQLDYVEKFYLKARETRGFGNKKFTAADLYAITFLPARANRNVLCVKGERWETGRKKGQLKNWYEANTGFDKNGDGKIEKSELQERMNACRVNENIFVA